MNQIGLSDYNRTLSSLIKNESNFFFFLNYQLDLENLFVALTQNFPTSSLVVLTILRLRERFMYITSLPPS